MIPIASRDQAKLAAQLIKRFDGVKHAEALDAVAIQSGYANWHAMAAKLPEEPQRGPRAQADVRLSFVGEHRAQLKLKFGRQRRPHILECDPLFEHEVMLLASHLCYLLHRRPSTAIAIASEIRGHWYRHRESQVSSSAEAALDSLTGHYADLTGACVAAEHLIYGPDRSTRMGSAALTAIANYMDVPFNAADIMVPAWCEEMPSPDVPSVVFTVPSDPYFMFSPAPIWALNILNAVVPPCRDYLTPDYGPQRSILSYTAKHLYRAFSEDVITPAMGNGQRLQLCEIKEWIRDQEKHFCFPSCVLPNTLRTWGKDPWEAHPDDASAVNQLHAEVPF